MKGYKVVKKVQDGLFHSCFAWGHWCVAYRVGERARGRDGTPLLAFGKERDARRFFSENWGFSMALFEAELSRPRRIKYRSSLFTTGGFWDFWAAPRRGQYLRAVIAPAGTVACDAVTLLKEVS